MTLHDLAIKVLPQYEPDNGPLTAAQLRQVRRHATKADTHIHERALQSMTGVVDQDVDCDALLADAPMQLDDCRNIRDIDLLHHDVDAVLPAECLGECLKPGEPARHQDQRVALLGILAGRTPRRGRSMRP